MGNINVVCISGNLTRDAEQRGEGTRAAVRFSVAVNGRAKDPSTGEWVDRPNYINCVVFGRYGESMAQRLTKGQKVAVRGELRYSTWEKDGQTRSALDVVASDVELIGARRDAAPAGGGAYASDDIPF